MLIVGDIRSIPRIDNLVVLNLTSANSYYPLVDLISVTRTVEYNTALDDEWFFNAVFLDNHYFMELMKIMNPLYEGKNVYLLINNHELLQPFNELITHLIISRYGYPSQYLNSITDFDEMDDSTFSFCGIKNMDADRSRMMHLCNI